MVGPFRWFTVPIGGQPRLVALREVRSAHGEMAQGFVIEPAEIHELLRRSRLPAQFLPGAAAARLQPTLEAAGARVEVAVAEDLPRAQFDRDALTKILQNLLDNAEKYTRASSNRSIRVALARAQAATVSYDDAAGGGAVFTVTFPSAAA
jgi:hypothetical protein